MNDSRTSGPPPTYFLMLTFEISSDQEELFNDIYDTEHAPYILAVEGVHSCVRFTDRSTSAEGWLVYSTLYRFDRPDLPDSPQWKAASDRGRWKDMIRPHVKSRQRRQGRIVAEYAK
ncbi:hypothetical protein H0A70_06305 [Alcaligenaceae bacterium]|nr:hypothetical protein [Alcaligenaceae bacterium]